MPKTLSIGQCRDFLSTADYGSFIDAVETEQIEFKSEPYRLESDIQKQELAKDVSGMANASGGVILIGFKTTKDPTILGDYVVELRPIPKAHFLRSWFAARCPEPSVTPVGSFEDWTIIVGGILQHVGIEGFLGNSSELYNQADAESIQWEAFLRTLDIVFYSEPFTVAQVWERMNDKTYHSDTHQTALTARADELRAALPDDYRPSD